MWGSWSDVWSWHWWGKQRTGWHWQWRCIRGGRKQNRRTLLRLSPWEERQTVNRKCYQLTGCTVSWSDDIRSWRADRHAMDLLNTDPEMTPPLVHGTQNLVGRVSVQTVHLSSWWSTSLLWSDSFWSIWWIMCFSLSETWVGFLRLTEGQRSNSQV